MNKYCGQCEYWDREFKGVASDIYKPCKHPRRMKNIGGIETRHSENHKCDIK